MARQKYEDLIQQLRDEGHELADEFEEYSATQLRKEAARAPELEKKVEELEKTNARLLKAPKLKDALEAQKVDFSALRKAERDALVNLDIDFEDEEAVRKVIEDYELPVTEEEQSQGEETDTQKVVSQARKAPVTRGDKTTIGPEDIRGKTTEAVLRIKDKFAREDRMDDWEALKRGETVNA